MLHRMMTGGNGMGRKLVLGAGAAEPLAVRAREEIEVPR